MIFADKLIVSKTQQKCKRDLQLSLATIAKAILRL